MGASRDGLTAPTMYERRSGPSYRASCGPRKACYLETAIKESVIRRDGAGNPALDKARKNARIDALSAFVIAEGLAEIVSAQPRRSWRSAGVVA